MIFTLKFHSVSRMDIYTGPKLSRPEAIGLGLKLYFTGKPCPHGHIDQRWVTSYGCVTCQQAYIDRKIADNPSHWTDLHARWRAKNPDKEAAKQARWKERRQDYDKAWRAKNLSIVRDRARAWAKRSRATPEGMVASTMRVHIRRSVKEKNFRSFEVVGYNPSDLVQHIERQFSKGMTWENYGEWHIDHILPIAFFTKQGIFDAKEINALSNLRPLWALDNIKKKDKRTHLL